MKKIGIYAGFLSLAFSSSAISNDSNEIESNFTNINKDKYYSNFSVDIFLGSLHHGADQKYNGKIGYFLPDENDDGTDEGKFFSFNEVNPGIAVKYNFSNFLNGNLKADVGLGVFYNSFEEVATFVSAGIQTTDKLSKGLPVGIGIDAMIIDGYDKGKEAGLIDRYADWPVLPMALPYLRIGPEDSKFTGKIGWIPKSLVKAAGSENPIHINTF